MSSIVVGMDLGALEEVERRLLDPAAHDLGANDVQAEVLVGHAPCSRPRRPLVRAPLDHDAEASALRDWESEGGHLRVRDSWKSAVTLADRPPSTDSRDAR